MSSGHRYSIGVAVFVLLVALAGLPGRATYGARTTADEPQYLITALSLANDVDLDISDELRAEEFTPFHEIQLNAQTFPVDAEGRRFSPHDPLLPVILAPAMAVGGWVAAKALLAVIAALTAALTVWLSVRRFAVSPPVAALVVTAFFVGAPFAAYATQVYPEMPAALVVVAVIALATAPRLGVRHIAGIGIGVVALPWLAIKYVPVAACLAVFAFWPLVRDRRWRTSAGVAAWFVACGLLYILIHQRIYGGWTVYAAGDHFVESGEFSVVGRHPRYLGRSRRLVGLLVDRRFGLVPWAPVWLLAPAAIARLAVDRCRGWGLMFAVFAAGWLTATFVAFTMHGWWSPGRQLVVVAPIVVVAVGRLVERWRWLRWPVAIAGLIGMTNWIWLAWEAATDRRTLVVDFFKTAAWPYRLVDLGFAEGWPATTLGDVLLVVWAAVLVVSVFVAVRPSPRRPHDLSETIPTDARSPLSMKRSDTS